MADSKPIKLLFQSKMESEESQRIRLVALLDKATLQAMLDELEKDPTRGAYAAGRMPSINTDIIVEGFDPEYVEKSKLAYTACLKDVEFDTHHASLI